MNAASTYGCSSCFSIIQWLDKIDIGNLQVTSPPPHCYGPDDTNTSTEEFSRAKRKRRHDSEAHYAMPPSPPGSTPIAVSPSKRQRIADDGSPATLRIAVREPSHGDPRYNDSIFDSDTTPRQARSRDVHSLSSTAPILSPTPFPFPIRPFQQDQQGQAQQGQHRHAHGTRSKSSVSRTSTTTSSQSQSRRTPSPAKRTIDLLTLAKPVAFVPDPGSKNQLLALLPEDVHELYETLHSIEFLHTPYIPIEAKEELEARQGKLPPYWFKLAGEEHNTAAALCEFKELDRICDFARRYTEDSSYESEWNAGVHLRILDQAVKYRPAVLYHVVSQAQIAPAFIPPVAATGSDRAFDVMIQKKMVDLALSIQPSQGSKLEEDIRRAVLAQSIAERTVSQTAYGALCFRPAAVAVETKMSSGDEKHGRVQLGVWTAAWHCRMRQFMLPGDEQRLVTLPVLLVAQHDWTLFFACDRGHRIEMVGPIGPIGNTRSIIGIYKLLASLKAVANWVDGPFQQWIANFFMSWSERNNGTSSNITVVTNV